MELRRFLTNPCRRADRALLESRLTPSLASISRERVAPGWSCDRLRLCRCDDDPSGRVRRRRRLGRDVFPGPGRYGYRDPPVAAWLAHRHSSRSKGLSSGRRDKNEKHCPSERARGKKALHRRALEPDNHRMEAFFGTLLADAVAAL